MKVLVTGATGNVGSLVVKELEAHGAELRVLTRKEPVAGSFAQSVGVTIGDMLDPAAMERALAGVDKLFLLNALGPAELTEALIAFGVAKRMRIKHICYLSMFKADTLRAVPHAAAKYAVERALLDSGIPYTILRPNYFIQNDADLRPVIEGIGSYPVPFGPQGISAVDLRDIAEAAAIALTEPGHAGQIYNLVGPEALKGTEIAELWTQLLNRKIAYAGDSVERWEELIRPHMPGWLVFDIRSMWDAFHRYGYAATDADVSRVSMLLGHAPRSYRAFIAALLS